MQKVDERAVIEESVVFRGDVTVGPQAFIGDGTVLLDGAVVDARAVLIAPSGTPDGCLTIAERVHIGAGAIISGADSVGQGAVVRPGSVVMDNVPAFAVVEGNPATVVSYTNEHGEDAAPLQFLPAPTDALASIDVCGATLTRLPEYADSRGSLSVLESGAGLPYRPTRVFFTYGVTSRHIRGSHAHRTLEEVLIALGGAITVVVDDGRSRAQVVLDSPSLALHVPPMKWLTQYAYTPDATLAVLASATYDESDYIRDYDEFRSALHE